jgi:hypothetical protein
VARGGNVTSTERPRLAGRCAGFSRTRTFEWRGSPLPFSGDCYGPSSGIWKFTPNTIISQVVPGSVLIIRDIGTPDLASPSSP